MSIASALDVIVVGAGPVGLTLAAELLRHGASCRIIDRNDGPRPVSRAALIQARTMEALDNMGVARDALHRGRTVHGLNVFAMGEQALHLMLDGMDTPFPFMLCLEQRDIELLLMQHLSRLGGKVERRARLGALVQDELGVTALIGHEDGREELVRASYLVGCDGAQSTVREVMGLPFRGEAYDQVALQADVRIRWPMPVADDEILAFFSQEGPIAALPLLAGGHYRVMTMVDRGASTEATLKDLQALMDRRGPAGTVLSDAAWMAKFPVSRNIVPTYRVGRAFLAGDAAHVQSPISAQGMNVGIQDACNLAWKLALVASCAGRPDLLRSYEQERRPMAEAALRTSDALMHRLSTSAGAGQPGDQVLAFLSALGPFREGVLRGAGMLGTHYRGSDLSQWHRGLGAPAPRWELPDGDSFGPGPLPGEYAPDVELVGEAGGKRRLRDLLHGTAHKLLLFSGAGAAAVDGERLGCLAARVAARYGRHVKSYLIVPHIVPPELLAGTGQALLDPDGAVHRRYGARSECLYLIRPDGYVGYRSEPAGAGPLIDYLRTVFTGFDDQRASLTPSSAGTRPASRS